MRRAIQVAMDSNDAVLVLNGQDLTFVVPSDNLPREKFSFSNGVDPSW